MSGGVSAQTFLLQLFEPSTHGLLPKYKKAKKDEIKNPKETIQKNTSHTKEAKRASSKKKKPSQERNRKEKEERQRGKKRAEHIVTCGERKRVVDYSHLC